MTILYPLTIPPSPKPIEASMYIERNQTAVEGFSRMKQIQRNPGDRWIGKITLPTMTKEQAQNWLGFFDALDGFIGSFLMAHPDFLAPNGSAGGVGQVSGGSQTGSTLVTDGWNSNQPTLFKRGDMIQVGVKLKRIVEDVASDGLGSATLTVMPAFLEPPADNTLIIINNPVGEFSLSEGLIAPTSNEMGHHTISFAFEEVLP